jgi:spore maturation protein CgeB
VKALVVGPSLADFDPGYVTSIGDALRFAGFDVSTSTFYVPTPPGILNRLRIDGGLALGFRGAYEADVRYFNRLLVERYRSEKPDIVLVIRGTKVSPESLDAMKGALRVLWLHDRFGRSDLSEEQIRRYDFRFVFEAGDVAVLKERFNLAADFLPIGFDPDLYRPLNGIRKDVDLCFVGAYYPERRALLERLAQDFRSQTLRFYGRHLRYREPWTWLRAAAYASDYPGVFVNRSLDAPAVNRLYARTKICLNLHHEQSRDGCNPRVFEILGSGGFQIVDPNAYVVNNLKDGVVFYRSYEQLRETVKWYLDDDEHRERVAARGREMALSQHTFGHRIRRLLDRLELDNSRFRHARFRPVGP